LASPQVNAIYCGDCTEVLHQYIPDNAVDLLYVDPPFFSNRKYEVIWGDGYELRAFEDRWKGGIENYLSWMEPKIMECHRVLKKTGTFWLHCDWHASHYLRVLTDRIFGYHNLQNEIIWQRTKSHNDPKQFGRVHDSILFYTKSNEWTWNAIYLSYDKKYLETAFKAIDKKTKKHYQTQPLHASKPGGDTYYEWKGKYPPKGRYWAFSKANMEKLDKEGRIVYSKTGVPRYKIYADESKGRPLQDVWVDIPGIHQVGGKERLGYPTQKPMALLERIVNVASNPMDIVLDPMCGCGTAIAVAQRLGRRWIGIDVSPTACKLMATRMRKLGFSIQDRNIIGLPKSLEEIKVMQPFEFQNWVMQKLMARISKAMSGDMGIDGWTLDSRPIQVKQSENIGRNVIDNFETALTRANKKNGIIVALSFGKGAYEEVARARLEQGLDIELKTVKDILGEQ
jgi:DNA modification methylase